MQNLAGELWDMQNLAGELWDMQNLDAGASLRGAEWLLLLFPAQSSSLDPRISRTQQVEICDFPKAVVNKLASFWLMLMAAVSLCEEIQTIR